MFFYPTALAEPGSLSLWKLRFLKSADSWFPKTAETDFSEICRNKITVYRQILNLYNNCIEQYAGIHTAKVKAIYEAIPGQLQLHEHKFQLSDLNNGWDTTLYMVPCL